MGRRGPPPQPTNIRILNGNPSRRPFNAKEPAPEPGEPPLPAYLDRKARLIWRRIVPVLLGMRVLTEADGEMLGSLAVICRLEREMLKILETKGFSFVTPAGYVAKRPEVGILERCLHLKRIYLGEFGMSPSSRSKIAAGGEERDELDAILTGTGR